jgi:Na+-driven multidrug efflux pump
VVKKQEGRVLASLAVGMLAAVPAYLLLTERLGLNGAGLAALASECVSALVIFMLARQPAPNILNKNEAMEVPGHALAKFDERP